MTALPIAHIVRGDVGRVLTFWPDATADLIIADPAYGLGTKGDWDLAPDYDIAWIREARRVLKPTGTFYVFGRPEMIAPRWQNFPEPKRWLTWAITNRVVPLAKSWQPTSEAIVMMWKGSSFFDADAVREEYGDDFKRQRGRRRPPTPGRFGAKESVFSAAAGALPRDVLRGPGLSGRVGKKEGLGHLCQKPLWLAERLVKASCPADGIVIDLFAGTSTFATAAQRLGRRWISVEQDERWCQVSLQRLRDAGATDVEIVTPPSPEVLADVAARQERIESELARLRDQFVHMRANDGDSI